MTHAGGEKNRADYSAISQQPAAQLMDGGLGILNPSISEMDDISTKIQTKLGN